MGSAGGSAGGSADNVYFHPDTSKFDVVNVYIYMRGVGTKDTTPEWGGDMVTMASGFLNHPSTPS